MLALYSYSCCIFNLSPFNTLRHHYYLGFSIEAATSSLLFRIKDLGLRMRQFLYIVTVCRILHHTQ